MFLHWCTLYASSTALQSRQILQDEDWDMPIFLSLLAFHAMPTRRYGQAPRASFHFIVRDAVFLWASAKMMRKTQWFWYICQYARCIISLCQIHIRWGRHTPFIEKSYASIEHWNMKNIPLAFKLGTNACVQCIFLRSRVIIRMPSVYINSFDF